MDDPRGVRRRKCRCYLDGNVEHLRHCHLPAFHVLAQRHTFDVFHHDARLAVPGFNHLMNRADIRMGKSRDGARLLLEPAEVGPVLREVPGQELERHVPSQPSVFGEINLAHSARTEGGSDAVLIDCLAGSQRPGIFSGHQLRRGLECGRVDEACRLCLVPEERFHFTTELLVAGALPGEKIGALLLAALECRVVDALDLVPSFRRQDLFSRAPVTARLSPDASRASPFPRKRSAPQPPPGSTGRRRIASPPPAPFASLRWLTP